jgi:hypothetical protein
VLNWVAEDEKQVLEYIVERRSETGSSFKTIGKVQAGPGQRNSNEYYFKDDQPDNGNNYYRVKVLDLKNNVFFSNTVNIKLALDGYFLYPNPVKETFQIRVPDQHHSYSVSIFDAGGALLFGKIFQRPVAGLIDCTFTNISPGILLIKISDMNNGSTVTKKVIKE